MAKSTTSFLLVLLILAFANGHGIEVVGIVNQQKGKTIVFTNHNQYNISFMNTSKSQFLRYNKQFLCRFCTKTSALS